MVVVVVVCWWAVDERLKAKALETVYQTRSGCGGSRKMIFKSSFCVVNYSATTASGRDVMLAL